MYEKFILCPGSLANVKRDGDISGFTVDVRLAYYRGLALSMIEGFDILIDGKAIDGSTVHLSVGGKTYTPQQMEQEIETRWEFTDAATITVPMQGGLAPGDHVVDLTEKIRISYAPGTTMRRDVKTMTVS